jgi:hypothetical protein
LAKGTSDVRPIAAGNIFRRLASKCVCFLLHARIRALFGDLQVGVACRGGAEQVVHSMRLALEANWARPDFMVLKVDFSNAFNSVDRQVMLEQCHQHFPELLPWVQWCYGGQPFLFFGDSFSLNSCVGVQQGDPLGPLLFCLVLHVLVQRISKFCPGLLLHKWYLDDGSMAGSSEQVLRTLGIISRVGPRLGLNLNLSKCELFSPRADNFGLTFSDPSLGLLSVPSDLCQRSTCPNFVLLGAPLGDKQFCEERVLTMRKANSRLLERLIELEDPQISLHLLRSCASFCRFVYLARTTPSQLIADALKGVDSDFHDCLCRFSALQLSDTAWRQSQLSLSSGGLGLRSVALHSSAAFVSSHTRALPDTITPHLCQSVEVVAGLSGDDVRPMADIVSDMIANKPSQHQLSSQIDKRCWLELVSSVPLADQIRLHALTAERASSWLQAMPSRGPFDLTLSPDQVQVLLQHRLGVPLSRAGDTCPLCNEHRPLDQLGHHQLTCSTCGFVVSRHNRVRDAVFWLLKSAGFNAAKEQGAYHGDQRRPADVLALDWSLGKAAAFDVTIVSPLTTENLHGAGDSDVVSKAADAKHKANDGKCAELGWKCIPLAVDTYGQWCAEAHSAFRDIAMRLSVRSKVPYAVALSSVYCTLAIVLARQNALSILARRDALPHLGAREVLLLSHSVNCS